MSEMSGIDSCPDSDFDFEELDDQAPPRVPKDLVKKKVV
jgi:hypothetical protein